MSQLRSFAFIRSSTGWERSRLRGVGGHDLEIAGRPLRTGQDDDGADRMLAPGVSDDFAVGAHALGCNELPTAFQIVGTNLLALLNLGIIGIDIHRSLVSTGSFRVPYPWLGQSEYCSIAMNPKSM